MKKTISIFLNVLFFLHVFLAFLVIFESHLAIPFWLQPVGRMHPLLLHFPVAFIALLVLLQLFKKQIDPVSFDKINYFLILLTSFTTVLATLMGLLLSLEGYESDLMMLHKWIGIAISFTVYAMVLAYRSKKTYQIVLYISFIGVVFGGHFGAGLTHGTHFLMEPITAAIKDPVDENTPIYTAYIEPILETKCTNCHNPQKHKGGLDLSSIEAIAKGGENGDLWLAHNPDESLFIKRTSLPLENEEHMPPAGKPQLTENEKELISAWIRHGVNTEVSFALLKQEDTLKQLVSEKWLTSTDDKIEKYTFDFADPKVIEQLNNPYRTVVQQSPSSPAIDVSIFGRSAFKTEYLTELEQIKDQIVYLNLANLPIKNETLKFVGQLNNLEHLVLNFTEITNEALSELTKCTKLQSLSISGTAVDVTALKNLKNLKSLKELFVWNTKMDASDIEHLTDELPEVTVIKGFVPDANEKLSLTPPALIGERNIIGSGDEIKLEHEMSGVSIRYTLDGSTPDEKSALFASEINLDLEGARFKTIKAIAYKDEWSPSEVSSFTFYDKGHVPNVLEVIYPGILSSYTGETAKILTDDVKNDSKIGFTKFWASYNTKPLIAIADFSASKPKIKEVVLSCGIPGNQKKSPIDFVEVWGSDDKENWKLLKRTNLANEKNLDKLREVSLKFSEVAYKYFKIVGQPSAKNTLRTNQLFFYQ